MQPDLILKKALEAHQKGQIDQAIGLYKECLKEADSLQALYMLAVAYYQTGQLVLSQETLGKFVALEKNNADAWNLLGNVSQDLGSLPEAISAFEMAVHLQPKQAMALNNLGTVYRQLRDYAKARECFEKAIAIKSNYFEAINNLGNIYLDQDVYQQALHCYEQALIVNPAYAQAHLNRGLLFQKMGRLEEALRCYEDLLTTNPQEVAGLWLYWLSLPSVYSSEEEIKKWRTRYTQGLAKVLASVISATSEQMAEHYKGMGMIAPFYLAYQGLEDCDLQRAFGDICVKVTQKLFPQWHQVLPFKQRRIKKVGFISAHLYQHTVTKLFFGWLKNLDKVQFESYVYHVGDKETPSVTQSWSEEALVYRRLTGVAPEIASVIKNDDLDVLIYLDIGMFPKINQLASLRLAPVQCMTWGHPVTSGFSTIDYFISSELMEPKFSQYTEKLQLLPHTSLAYLPPESKSDHKMRADFGLAESDCVYLCCQLLSKYLPQFDFVFAKIAKEVPSSRFVFINNNDLHSSQVFRERLQRAFEAEGLDSQKHVLFVPYMQESSYQDLNRLSDIFLDSILWSGGNTTLEAAFFDLPIVTCRGPFMRSNHSAAILSQMGLDELITLSVTDYIHLAVKLGLDSSYRMEVKRLISQNKAKLINDVSAVLSLEEFVCSVTT